MHLHLRYTCDANTPVSEQGRTTVWVSRRLRERCKGESRREGEALPHTGPGYQGWQPAPPYIGRCSNQTPKPKAPHTQPLRPTHPRGQRMQNGEGGREKNRRHSAAMSGEAAERAHKGSTVVGVTRDESCVTVQRKGVRRACTRIGKRDAKRSTKVGT